MLSTKQTKNKIKNLKYKTSGYAYEYNNKSLQQNLYLFMCIFESNLKVAICDLINDLSKPFTFTKVFDWLIVFVH